MDELLSRLVLVEGRLSTGIRALHKVYKDQERGLDPDSADVVEALDMLGQYYKEYLEWYDKYKRKGNFAEYMEDLPIRTAYHKRWREIQDALKGRVDQMIALDNAINQWHRDYPVIAHLSFQIDEDEEVDASELVSMIEDIEKILSALGRLPIESPYVKESSIDFPKTDLALSVWEEEDGVYHLRPEVRDKILHILDAYEPIDLEDMAREIRIVGSMGTNLYTDDADIDVHIVPKDFSGWDEDKVKALQDWFEERYEELDAYIGKHPVEVYVQLNPPQDLMSDSAYNLLDDTWLVGPKIVATDYDPYTDFSHIANDIRQATQNADLLMGELKRDVIDFDVISAAMQEMPAAEKKKLQLTLQNKLAEMEKDIEALYFKRKEWVSNRRDASKPTTPEQARNDVELAKKWKDTNATFKFINRYQYLKVIEDLEKLIAVDGDVSKEDVDVIRNIVGM